MKPLFPTPNAVFIFILSVAGRDLSHDEHAKLSVIILGSVIILRGRLEAISNILVVLIPISFYNFFQATLSIVFLLVIILKRDKRDVERILLDRTPAYETGLRGMAISSNILTPYSLSGDLTAAYCTDLQNGLRRLSSFFLSLQLVLTSSI
jgi:hypothetical protein